MTPYDISSGDPRGTSQGAGTGRAVIYQDRFDPADGFMNYALMNAERKAKRQQQLLDRQKEVNAKISSLDYEVKDEIDNEELALARDQWMRELVTVAKSGQYGDILDPGSEAGRLMFKAQKELDAASTLSASNSALLDAQMKLFTNNPGEYNADEYEKRLDYFKSLKTIKERNDFLMGTVGMPGADEGAGIGLLVENVNFLAPIEDLSAAEYQRVFETPEGVTTTTAGARRDDTRELVVRKLASSQSFDRQVNRWIKWPIDGYSGDVDGYVNYLTDQLIDQVKEVNETRRDQKDGFVFGDGYTQTDSMAFRYGAQEAKYAMFEGQKTTDTPANMNLEELGIGDDDLVGIAAIGGSKGKSAPVFGYTYTDANDKPQRLIIAPSKVIKIGDRYFLEGTANLEASTAGKGEIERDLASLGGTLAKGDAAIVPLDVAGNNKAFEVQSGIPLSVVGAEIDKALQKEQQNRASAPPKPKAKTTREVIEDAAQKAKTEAAKTTTAPATMDQEVDAQIEAAFSKPLEAGSKEVIENRVKSLGDSVKFEGNKAVIRGVTYDLSDDTDVKVLKALYGTTTKK